MKFEIFKGKNRQYYFRLKAGNGKTVLASEGYDDPVTAKNGVETVIASSSSTEYFERQLSPNQKHYFLLKTRSGTIIARSQMYQTRQGMEKGIALVRRVTAETAVREMPENEKKKSIKQ